MSNGVECHCCFYLAGSQVRCAQLVRCARGSKQLDTRFVDASFRRRDDCFARNPSCHLTTVEPINRLEIHIDAAPDVSAQPIFGKTSRLKASKTPGLTRDADFAGRTAMKKLLTALSLGLLVLQVNAAPLVSPEGMFALILRRHITGKPDFPTTSDVPCVASLLECFECWLIYVIL